MNAIGADGVASFADGLEGGVRGVEVGDGGAERGRFGGEGGEPRGREVKGEGFVEGFHLRGAIVSALRSAAPAAKRRRIVSLFPRFLISWATYGRHAQAKGEQLPEAQLDSG